MAASTSVVQYAKDSDTSRGPSPGVWNSCQAGIRPDLHIFYHEDFLNYVTDSQEAGLPWFFKDTNATATALATEVGGVVQIASSSTQNTGGVLITGDNTAGMVKFTAGKSLWMEMRIRMTTVTATNIFAGLCAEGCAAADFLTDTSGVLASKNVVGYRIIADDYDGIDCIFDSATGTVTVVKNAAHTAVLATWVKLGLRYDATNDKVYWLVNGTKVAGQTLTRLATTNFPDGEEMALVLATKNPSAAASVTVDIDWWQVAMDN